jgi:hypothetical protein
MNKKYMVSKAYTTMKIWIVDEAENGQDAIEQTEDRPPHRIVQQYMPHGGEIQFVEGKSGPHILAIPAEEYLKSVDLSRDTKSYSGSAVEDDANHPNFMDMTHLYNKRKES